MLKLYIIRRTFILILLQSGYHLCHLKILKSPGCLARGASVGVVRKDLSYELLWNVGRATATNLNPSSKVLIATDSRESRDLVKAIISMGLLAGGVNVIDAGILPTPILAFATVDMGMDLGIMITASHNPPEYNGVKLFTAEGIGYNSAQENDVLWLKS